MNDDYYERPLIIQLYTLDFRLNLTSEKRISIRKFRQKNHFLYHKNTSVEIQNDQGVYEWNELPDLYKTNLTMKGYSEDIWNEYKWPIKVGIDKLYDLYKIKFYKYYFNIMIDKCLFKRNKYEKIFTWIKMKSLYDYKRTTIKKDKDFIIINLPSVLFEIILSLF
jgi:hypothetical protein